jgi:DNA-binding transcriptional regulator YdaS (Cro superfamily)
MSKLAAWLERTETKRSAFAESVGVSPSYVTQLCAGTIWPGRDVIERIRDATGGEVTANDFMTPAAPVAGSEAA